MLTFGPNSNNLRPFSSKGLNSHELCVLAHSQNSARRDLQNATWGRIYPSLLTSSTRGSTMIKRLIILIITALAMAIPVCAQTFRETAGYNLFHRGNGMKRAESHKRLFHSKTLNWSPFDEAHDLIHHDCNRSKQ